VCKWGIQNKESGVHWATSREAKDIFSDVVANDGTVGQAQ